MKPTHTPFQQGYLRGKEIEVSAVRSSNGVCEEMKS